MHSSFTFGRHDRLKRRKIIEALFRDGKYFHVAPIRIQYQFTILPQGVLQVGVTASSRNFKKAVHRNRIKRLLREAWRLQRRELENSLANKRKGLAVFLVYTGKELPNYDLIYEKTGLVLARLLELVQKEEE